MERKAKPATMKGPAENFTGDVWLDPVYRGEEPSRTRVNIVRFSPGARTAWHSHAIGQTLYVTEGVGRVQARGGAMAELRAGDIVYAPADEVHWHGASPDHFMIHVSITEGVGPDQADNPEADWHDHVTDEEYGG